MSRYFGGKLHINLRSAHYDQAKDFYINKLGFVPMFEIYDPSGRQLQYLQIGEGVHLELYNCDGAEVEQIPDKQSFTHFALYVEDLDATVKQLMDNGVKFYLDTYTQEKFELGVDKPIHGTCGCNIVWIMDPDGNRIEIMGMTNESLQVNRDPDWSKRTCRFGQ